METIFDGTITKDEYGIIRYRNRDDKLHRTDGPAIIWPTGAQEFWVDGKRVTPEEFALRSAPCAGKTVEIDGKKYKLTPV